MASGKRGSSCPRGLDPPHPASAHAYRAGALHLLKHWRSWPHLTLTETMEAGSLMVPIASSPKETGALKS